MQNCSVPKDAKPSGVCTGSGLAKAPRHGPPWTWRDSSPSCSLSPPHPSSRGIVLNQPLDQTQEENDQGDRVLLDIPYIPYVAHWVTHKYQRGESKTSHAKDARH